MIDHSRPAAPSPAEPSPDTLADFTPVPRHYNRHDGWTPERQRRFIDALADLGSVKAAAHAVNMAPEGAYMLRRHPQAASFRAAWEAALALGVQRLEDVAMERALHGVEVPLYCFGKLIGTRTVFNDALLMFLLRNRSPARFAADSLANASASTRGHLERLKREWRAEWEAEREAERLVESAREEAEIHAAIDRRLDLMRARAEHAAAFRAENPELYPDPDEPDPAAQEEA